MNKDYKYYNPGRGLIIPDWLSNLKLHEAGYNQFGSDLLTKLEDLIKQSCQKYTVRVGLRTIELTKKEVEELRERLEEVGK